MKKTSILLVGILLGACSTAKTAFIDGAAAFEKGDYAVAKVHLAKCPKDPYCQYLLGNIHFEENHFQEASKYFLVASKQGFKNAYFHAGVSILAEHKQPSEGKEYSADMLDGLGWLWLAKENGTDVSKIFSDAIFEYAKKKGISPVMVPPLVLEKVKELEIGIKK